MNGTATIDNVTPTGPQISGVRRKLKFNYLMAGICTMVVAAAITFGAACPAAAGSKPAKQALWVANNTDVVEFSKLPSGVHDQKPLVQLDSSVFGAPQGVVFDSSNDLWVIDGGTVATGGTTPPSLEEFTEAQLGNLKKDPTPTPTIQITSADFVFPQQAVFDGSGNLWVSDNGANAVFVITPAQLTAGGDISFTTTIESDPPFDGPLGIAINGGNLYIANNATTTIFEFNADHLPAIGSGLTTLVPDVVLSDDGSGSIQGPWALIFDAAGDLWSSNANSPFTLVKFGASQITATGDPTPEVTISPVDVKVSKKVQDESLQAPNGIAFDDKGDLVAISSASPFGVADYNPKEQAANGSPKPTSLVVGAKTTLDAPAGANFGPAIKH
jgi:hypothetical protein